MFALLVGVGGAVVAQEPDEEGPASSVDIQTVADMIAQAWTPEYDEAKVEAIYDPEVLMMLDADVLARDREQIKSVIEGGLGVGNRYRHISPVVGYEDDDGDLYIAAIVEVGGTYHPSGDPVVGFWRVHDGKVIRHIFMYAPDY
jgi:hypothetical protein